MACQPRTRRLVVAAVVAGLTLMCLGYVPRAYVSYAGIPILEHIGQPEEYGTDTIADMYEAKVVLNDWRDMYTKTGVPQTPLEARTWTREASAPYPPVALVVEAAIYWVGEKTGVGFYGLMLALAAIFVAQAARYCLSTRWYVFPLLGVSGLYFGYRFTYVQDCTYLILLVAVMAAIGLARRRPALAHLLMAFAIAVKVSPLYYAMNLPRMRRWTAMAFVAVLVAAFVLPYFVLDNYLYIFTFQNEIKGGGWRMVGALVVSVPFAILLAYVSVRRGFDLEDRIGWGVLPVAILLAFNLNVARHVLVVLLVPDKRARRTVAAAVAMALYYLSFGLIGIELDAADLRGVALRDSGLRTAATRVVAGRGRSAEPDAHAANDRHAAAAPGHERGKGLSRSHAKPQRSQRSHFFFRVMASLREMPRRLRVGTLCAMAVRLLPVALSLYSTRARIAPGPLWPG